MMKSVIMKVVIKQIKNINPKEIVPAWIWSCSDVFVHHVSVQFVFVEETFATNFTDARFLIVGKVNS